MACIMGTCEYLQQVLQIFLVEYCALAKAQAAQKYRIKIHLFHIFCKFNAVLPARFKTVSGTDIILRPLFALLLVFLCLALY